MQEIEYSFRNEANSLIIERDILTKTIFRVYQQDSHLTKIQRDKLLTRYQHQLAVVVTKIEELENAEESENDGDTSLVPTDLEPVGPSTEEKSEKTKAIELKRLFHKIAEHTHPDKVGVSGVSEKEAARLEKLFKKWFTVFELRGNS